MTALCFWERAFVASLPALLADPDYTVDEAVALAASYADEAVDARAERVSKLRAAEEA